MKLDELIRTTKGGRSYVALARDTGGKLGAARWQQIATKPLLAFPDPASIAAIAQALRIPQRTVILAVAESLGLEVETRPTLVDLIPDRARDLPPQCVAAVLSTVDAMLTLQGPANE